MHAQESFRQALGLSANHLKGSLLSLEPLSVFVDFMEKFRIDAASQYVDVTDDGPNPYKAPVAGDLRGQCPGLNAAANHNSIENTASVARKVLRSARRSHNVMIRILVAPSVPTKYSGC